MGEFEIRKAEKLRELDMLEVECKRLLKLIPIYRHDVMKIETEEEAVEYDLTHDLEQDAMLEIIRLF